MSAREAKSTSRIDRLSNVPIASGSISGCDGGADTGGSVFGSGPSSVDSGVVVVAVAWVRPACCWVWEGVVADAEGCVGCAYEGVVGA